MENNLNLEEQYKEYLLKTGLNKEDITLSKELEIKRSLNKYIHIKPVQIPIYHGKLVLVFSNSKKKVNKLLPDYKFRKIHAHAAYNKYKGDEAFFIILNFSPVGEITHGVIAHEAAHIAHFIEEDRNIQPDNINDEAFAYLIEWIVEEVYKYMKSLKIEI